MSKHKLSKEELINKSEETRISVGDIEYSEEMIELEYLMATFGSMDSTKKEERKQRAKTRLAALLIGLGIEAELPPEFFDKLLHSKRAKVLLRNLIEDIKTKKLINQLNNC